jgi:hypothetical protein
VRDEFAADTYEDFLKSYQVSSGDLFTAIGDIAGVSQEIVRQAVKKRRKSKK